MKVDLEQFGFRKGFSYEDRFDLKTQVGDYLVSTVDLGINHQYVKELPPLYYETMIFKVKNEKVNYRELYCDRYTTEEEARIGHQEAIEWVKENLIGDK